MLILCIVVAIPTLLAGFAATEQVTGIGRHSAPLVRKDAQRERTNQAYRSGRRAARSGSPYPYSHTPIDWVVDPQE